MELLLVQLKIVHDFYQHILNFLDVLVNREVQCLGGIEVFYGLLLFKVILWFFTVHEILVSVLLFILVLVFFQGLVLFKLVLFFLNIRVLLVLIWVLVFIDLKPVKLVDILDCEFDCVRLLLHEL